MTDSVNPSRREAVLGMSGDMGLSVLFENDRAPECTFSKILFAASAKDLGYKTVLAADAKHDHGGFQIRAQGVDSLSMRAIQAIGDSQQAREQDHGRLMAWGNRCIVLMLQGR